MPLWVSRRRSMATAVPMALNRSATGVPRCTAASAAPQQSPNMWLFGGSCGLTPRRIAPQRRTQVPHSATGDSRKDALWGCHPHGKAHSGGITLTEKCTLQPERSPRVRLSVRARAQSASLRDVPSAECAFP